MGETAAIDRAHALEAFHRYVEPYDANNPRIALKVEHTLRVAELADRIAAGSGFTEAGRDVTWLCGLLHDLGRFEQLRRWDTFNDGDSVNHATLGASILFGEGSVAFATAESDDDVFAHHNRTAGSIRAFCDDPALDSMIRAAVAHHSDFRLPEALDVRTHAICDVVRDADKLDILRVTCTDTVETVLGVSEDELLESTISPAVEDAFFAHRTVARAERETPADYLVSLACFTYELVYPTSLEIALEQGFLFQPFERPFGIEKPFAAPSTRFLMNRMDGHLRGWIDERL